MGTGRPLIKIITFFFLNTRSPGNLKFVCCLSHFRLLKWAVSPTQCWGFVSSAPRARGRGSSRWHGWSDKLTPSIGVLDVDSATISKGVEVGSGADKIPTVTLDYFTALSSLLNQVTASWEIVVGWTAMKNQKICTCRFQIPKISLHIIIIREQCPSEKWGNFFENYRVNTGNRKYESVLLCQEFGTLLYECCLDMPYQCFYPGLLFLINFQKN